MIRGENSAADGTSGWSALRTAAAFLEEFRSENGPGNSAKKVGREKGPDAYQTHIRGSEDQRGRSRPAADRREDGKPANMW